MRVESGERALATAHGWPRETMMGGECLPPAPCLDDTVLGRRFSTVCPSSTPSRGESDHAEITLAYLSTESAKMCSLQVDMP